LNISCVLKKKVKPLLSKSVANSAGKGDRLQFSYGTSMWQIQVSKELGLESILRIKGNHRGRGEIGMRKSSLSPFSLS